MRDRDSETDVETERTGRSGSGDWSTLPAPGMLTQSLPCLSKRSTGGVQNTQENINQYRRKEDVCFFTHLRKSPSNTPWGASYFSAWK